MPYGTVVNSTAMAKYAANPPRKTQPNEWGNGVIAYHGVYEAAALTGRNTIRMCLVPAGVRIIDAAVRCDANTVGATQSFAVTVGDDSDTDRYITTVNLTDGTAGASERSLAVDGAGFETTSEDYISVYTADACSYTGTVKLTVLAIQA